MLQGHDLNQTDRDLNAVSHLLWCDTEHLFLSPLVTQLPHSKMITIIPLNFWGG